MSSVTGLLLTSARKQATHMALPQMARRSYSHQKQFATMDKCRLDRKLMDARMKNNMGRLYATFVLAEASRKAKMQRVVAQLEAEMSGVDEESRFLSEYSLVRAWNAILRMAHLSIMLVPPVVLLKTGNFLGSEQISDIGWKQTISALERAGPTYIKLAQWASTRSDLFGEEATGRLSKLRDKTRPHKWKDTVKILKEELGDYWENVIQIDETDTPLGSGCIAQVYDGVLKQGIGALPEGTKLAVKVQHPNLQRKVATDFYILQKFGSFLEGLPMLVNAFKECMFPQLNFLAELNNLSTFRKNFEGDTNVRFPRGIEQLSTPSILVESFCYGENILEFKATPFEKRKLAEMGLEMVMKMIFLHDFIHGDLHPGNILVERFDSEKESEKNSSWWSVITGNKTGLIMNVIDCGLVVKMGLDEHKNLVEILGNFIKREGYIAGKRMIDHQGERDISRGREAESLSRTSLDEELFCRGIEQICVDDEQNNFLENIGDYLADICYLACKHQVKLEAKFINTALACEIVEGIATKLYPEMNVQEIALPMVFKAELMHGLRSSNIV